MKHTEVSKRARQVLDYIAEGIIKPEQFLQGLIIDGFVAIEQMVECEQDVKTVLAQISVEEMEKLSLNIIIINGWIQDVMRKGKK